MQEIWETWVWSLGQEESLEEGMATHSSILAWRIPWIKEPGRLQSIGSHSQARLKQQHAQCDSWWMTAFAGIWIAVIIHMGATCLRDWLPIKPQDAKAWVSFLGWQHFTGVVTRCCDSPGWGCLEAWAWFLLGHGFCSCALLLCWFFFCDFIFCYLKFIEHWQYGIKVLYRTFYNHGLWVLHSLHNVYLTFFSFSLFFDYFYRLYSI